MRSCARAGLLLLAAAMSAGGCPQNPPAATDAAAPDGAPSDRSPMTAPDGGAPAANQLKVDRWTPMAVGPLSRVPAVAVWTGREMVIWGGAHQSNPTTSPGPTATGARYDPVADRWMPMAAGPPSAAPGGVGVWTGRELIVWGGRDTTGRLVATGARYDPDTDRWTTIAATGAPAPRSLHRAVWTGREMVVWGGIAADSTPIGGGGRYDPAADVWVPISELAAPPPARHQSVTVVQAGAVVVFGGATAMASLDLLSIYDPARDAWRPSTATGAPAARDLHSAVFTGADLIVWGGFVRTPPPGRGAMAAGTGGRYAVGAATWWPTSETGAPSPRHGHVAVWADGAGSQGSGLMLVVGGIGTGHLSDGFAYDPNSDRWLPIASAGAPSPRTYAAGVWTGRQLLVWGGQTQSADWTMSLATGARYEP